MAKKSSKKKQRWVVTYTYKVGVDATTEDEAYERAAEVLDAEGRIKPQDLDCVGAEPEVEANKIRLFAIVDDGNYDGDSTYYCPQAKVPYTEGMTLADIKAAFKAAVMIDNEDCPAYQMDEEEAQEAADNIAVAWVVTEKQVEQLANAWPDVGNDSATYAANHTMKLMAEAMAKKVIKEEA